MHLHGAIRLMDERAQRAKRLTILEREARDVTGRVRDIKPPENGNGHATP
jgi:hypothetical protein